MIRNKLGESLEDYLETLLVLEAKGKIRCVDVAKAMNVSKPSVNKAMNVLKEKGYVEQVVYGDIHLTDEGREIAKGILIRHETISNFFVNILNVSKEVADEDACHIEHALSDETFMKLKQLMEIYLKGKE